MSCACATNVLAVIVACLAAIVATLRWWYNYWERQHVPYIPASFPGGNVSLLRKKTVGLYVKEWYDEFKSKGHKYGGTLLLGLPILNISDLELVRLIMLKDFQHFTDRGFYYNEKDDPISGHLLNLEGQRWKTLRAKLTPAFTSGKLKMMLQILVDCSARLEEPLTLAAVNHEPIDIKDVFACFTTDVIGSCAFGIECNTFKNKDSPFRLYGKRAVEPTVLDQLHSFFLVSFPRLAKSLRMKVAPPEVAAFFMKLVNDTVTLREQSKTTRNDFLQILIDMKNDSKSENALTMNEIAAQVFIFFLGGFETSSTTGAFCLYELSLQQDIQNKLRREIEEVLEKHDGKPTYEAIQEMKYMEQVINETLRKYPPLPFLNRSCTKEYHVPGTEYVIKEGTRILISSWGIQNDPDYFPDPAKFDPDRFSDDNKKNIQPYTFIPFGEGPRICIGLRFGMLQTKIGLIKLLKSYRFSLDSKTRTPLQLNSESVILSVEGGVWLNVEKIQ